VDKELQDLEVESSGGGIGAGGGGWYPILDI
jgi:hypothetical protein